MKHCTHSENSIGGGGPEGGGGGGGGGIKFTVIKKVIFAIHRIIHNHITFLIFFFRYTRTYI